MLPIRRLFTEEELTGIEFSILPAAAQPYRIPVTTLSCMIIPTSTNPRKQMSHATQQQIDLLHIGSWIHPYDIPSASQGVLHSPGSKYPSLPFQNQNNRKVPLMLQAMLGQPPKADPWSPVAMQQKRNQKLSRWSGFPIFLILTFSNLLYTVCVRSPVWPIFGWLWPEAFRIFLSAPTCCPVL